MTQNELEEIILNALRAGTPPASAGDVTRALNALGVNVTRDACKRALVALTKREPPEVFAFARVFWRAERYVHGTAYGTLQGMLNETKSKEK